MSNFDMDWLQDFDPTAAVEAVKAGDIIPDGDYDFEITRIDTHKIDNERAAGMRLAVELTCKSSGHAKRKVFDSIIVKYVAKQGADSEKAIKTQQIGRAKFGSLCIASGLSKASDLDALIGKFVRAKIGNREYNGKVSNEVKGQYLDPVEMLNAKRPMSNDSPWS
jgi:hypothetical protein